MRHLLTIGELTRPQAEEILATAAALKAEWKAAMAAGRRQPAHLDGRVCAIIFEKPSLRTRCSFEAGMFHLGGHAINLAATEIGRLGERESISDLARNLSRWAQIIQARVFSHANLLELVKWSSVPVVNGLSDYEHPTQIFADYLTIQEQRGGFDGLKLAWIGDCFNVSNSLMAMAALFNHEMVLAAPAGYDPQPEIWAVCEKINPNARNLIRLVRDPAEAVQGADVLYTDTWISMGQEKEAAQRIKDFTGYQINAELLAKASANAFVMHDMPAYRGKEITDDVLDGDRCVAFEQAENRLHAIKAILCWCSEVTVS